MKKMYNFILLAVLCVSASNLSAQRYVLIEQDTEAGFVDIFPIIMGDTTATGERVDNNTIYQLQNGGVYVVSDRLGNKPEWPLHIEAEDLEDTENKPYIGRLPNDSGGFPKVIYSEGDLTLKNLWLETGQKLGVETSDWGQIRLLAGHTRTIVDNCLIEDDRGGFVQVRADSVKIYITNSVFRNGGNRRILEGNGRGIDSRQFVIDTLVMQNTIVHNIVDRFFRSQGGRVPHNYIEIDHCTAFNVMGRHGFIQLGRVNEVKITNNLFMNPIMLGSSPAYTDEQTQPDNDAHKVITVDTLYEATSFEISNNNIFWDAEVTEHWATIDTVSEVAVLSDLIMERMGDDAANAYFSEPISLNAVPQSALQYVKDLYADPTSQEMFDIIVEDIAFEGTDSDSGNLFDFSTWDPCYSGDATSATSDSEGDAVGAVAGCADLQSGIEELPINLALELMASPNPTTGLTNISFSIEKHGRVDLNIYDFQGRVIKTLISEERTAGAHSVEWNTRNEVPAGMYFTQVATPEGRMFIKIVVQ